MNTSPARRTATGSAALMDGSTPLDHDPVAEVDESASGRTTYTATGLPDGLSISTDGVISGAVTSLGTHTVTITSTGTAAQPHSVTFNWIVL